CVSQAKRMLFGSRNVKFGKCLPGLGRGAITIPPEGLRQQSQIDGGDPRTYALTRGFPVGNMGEFCSHSAGRPPVGPQSQEEPDDFRNFAQHLTAVPLCLRSLPWRLGTILL